MMPNIITRKVSDLCNIIIRRVIAYTHSICLLPVLVFTHSLTHSLTHSSCVVARVRQTSFAVCYRDRQRHSRKPDQDLLQQARQSQGHQRDGEANERVGLTGHRTELIFTRRHHRTHAGAPKGNAVPPMVHRQVWP